MGTTRDAFNAGSTSFVWVVAIEGYERLLTSGSTSAAVTAWSGTDWSSATGGLFVDLSVNQSLSPDAPMSSMGSCSLWIVPTPGDDTFGVATGRKTSSFETFLDATADNDDTTLTVKSTTGLTGGVVHIGTECIAYSGTTATTLTGCTRGKYSPFGTYADVIASFASGRHFGQYHRVGLGANSVNLQPRVTNTQREWVGRWVGIWAHRVVNGVLDVRAQAELAFAGKIVEVRDDPNSFATVVQLKGVADVFSEATIGASQWQGSGTGGIYLSTGLVFEWGDTLSTVSGGTPTISTKTANTLTVVASGASGANQINAGYYTPSSLCSKISTWLASERAAGRLNGTYSIASPVNSGTNLRTRIIWTLTGTNAAGGWVFGMPPAVAPLLGFTPQGSSSAIPGNVTVGFAGVGTLRTFDSDQSPQNVAVQTDGGDAARAQIITSSGDLLDQYTTIPSVLRPPSNAVNGTTYNWGLFVINDERLVRAAFATSSPTELLFIQSIQAGALTFSAQGNPLFGYAPIASSVFNIRQVYAVESDPVLIILSLAISTGTAGYNNPLLSLPFGCGASIPYELVQDMIDSITGIPSLGGTMVIILEKPTKVIDVLSSDLGFRWAFTNWRNANLQAGAWKIPTSTLAVVTLDESNKGEPMGNKVEHRTATAESSEWIRQIVKIRYNRNAADPKGDDYTSSIQFEDRAAVDSAGGAPNTVTLSLRNTYSEFSGTGQSVESLLPNYLALMPMISRPARRITRSIDPTLFLQIGLGDVVLVTDTFARDPESGLRGVTERPALVTRIRYTWGGWLPGADKATPPGGEVDLFFTDVNPDRVGAPYVPSADINDLYSVASFDHGYLAAGPTIHCLTNRYTETTDTPNNDVGSFAAGDKILIIERDPLDPTNPIQWSRTIATNGVNGDEITLTAALSSPAWDNTKRYHVIAQDYASATSSQHSTVFQADDVNGLVVSTAQPYLYGTGSADQTFTTNASMAARYPFGHPNDVEIPASSRYADGAARDVAHEAAMLRLVDHIIDYDTACQLPMLFNSVVSNTTATGSSLLFVAYFPIYLGSEVLTNSVLRRLTVAPWAYSTDGTSTSARITLSRERPSFSTTTDVPWSGTYSQYTWTGITSTTAGTLADGTVVTNVKSPTTGLAWCSLELGYKCATRGIAKLVESARSDT